MGVNKAYKVMRKAERGMSCSGIEERVTQLDPATWKMNRLPDRELATHNKHITHGAV
jgi:hypothetical protein